MKKELGDYSMDKVLAIRKDILFANGRELVDGFTTIHDAREVGIDEHFLMAHGEYLSEKALEIMHEYVGVATYAAIRSDSGTFLTYQRGDREPRLKDKWSIGLGGHVRPAGHPERNVIRSSLGRSIDREVTVGSRLTGLPILGIISGGNQQVDQYHIGLFFVKHVYDIENIKVREGAEKDVRNAGFKSQAEIEELRRGNKFEDWSVIGYEELLKRGFFRNPESA